MVYADLYSLFQFYIYISKRKKHAISTSVFISTVKELAMNPEGLALSDGDPCRETGTVVL